MPNKVVVLGAGVSGLTTAFLLSQDPTNEVTVLSKHMPRDYDVEYASPWAGANYMPVGKTGSAHARWERETWPFLANLAQKHPDAGIHFQQCCIFNRVKDKESATGQWFSELTSPDPWYKDVVPDFKTIPADELPAGIDSAQSFTSVCINTAIYLPWLVGQCAKNGCVFKRAMIKHVSEAIHQKHSGKQGNIVVNCTGLSARNLGGVLDKTVHPVRGQIVIVRNDPGKMASISGSDDGNDEVSYIMPRAAGGGTIIGGTYQKDDWNSTPDPNLAVRIMKRVIALLPQLVKDGKGVENLDIVRHAVGLRPVRDDGPRIEKDLVDGTKIVHNYGHGGFGYQVSWSCAKETVSLVSQVLQEPSQPKL